MCFISQSPTSSVPLKPRLGKGTWGHASLRGISSCRRESVFLVAPCIAEAQCESILYDILPSLLSLPLSLAAPLSRSLLLCLRFRVHARRLRRVPAEDIPRATLPALVRLKEFREFARPAATLYSVALNFSNGSRRKRRVPTVFSEIFFLLATWTLTKLRPRVRELSLTSGSGRRMIPASFPLPVPRTHPRATPLHERLLLRHF